MKTQILKQFRAVASAGRHVTIDDLIEQARSSPNTIGEWMWDNCSSGSDRRDFAASCADWPGWPTCQCSCCGCDEPAVSTDDVGNPTCDACEEYTTDNGDVICANDSRAETVVESCGAGNQTRSYVRLKPPEMPDESDADGEYCLYWATCGNESHVVTRYSTREQAEQAVAAKDWPRPGDNTNYLCGYEARQLVDGQWLPLEQD